MNVHNTALIVIDVINSCAHPNCESIENNITFNKIREIVPRLKNFIDKFKNLVGSTVIYTKTTPWTKQFVAPNITELYSNPNVTAYSLDTSGFSEKFYIVEPTYKELNI